MTPTPTQFHDRLIALRSAEELRKIQRFFTPTEDDQFIGVRMGQVFALAKEFVSMKPEEIEILLESPIHEMRVGGVSIMDFQARDKKIPEMQKKELFDLYLRRHDRINNWDLVDRSAIYVVGSFLINKPRDILYQLAVSDFQWERRTAIVSTAYFMKKDETADTFKIAALQLKDTEDLMHKATGWMLRTAGSSDRPGLVNFLETHAHSMPRAMLRNALEHFEKPEREYYLTLKKAR